MASINLTAGTIEIVPVDVVDRTSSTTDLSTCSPTFTVLDDNDLPYYEAESTTAVNMRISPLLNTSATHVLGAWPVGHYRLFVGFDIVASSESVYLGPVDIYLIDSNIAFT